MQILVRKRLYRYTRSDRGRAIEKAGRPPGWRDTAERAVEPMNIDRNGVVFVSPPGHRVVEVVARLADASRAVHEAVLVLTE